MLTITISKTQQKIQVPKGTYLMDALYQAQLPIASACEGEGVCARCKIQILEGHSQLSPETPLEIELKERNKIPSQERISCQTKVNGDITVDTPYW